MFAASHTELEEAGTFQDTFVPYYATNATNLVQQKVREKAKYDSDLRALFEAEAEATG